MFSNNILWGIWFGPESVCRAQVTGAEADRLSRLSSPAGVFQCLSFRCESENRPIEISLQGLTLNLDPAHPDLAPAFEPPGSWNRLEIRTAEPQRVLTVNGRSVPASFSGAQNNRGLISLAPTGPADFSNIYVRTTESRAGASPEP